MILRFTCGDLIYKSSINLLNTVKFSLYSGTLWNDHFNLTDITLVNLALSRDIFYYCDFSKV